MVSYLFYFIYEVRITMEIGFLQSTMQYTRLVTVELKMKTVAKTVFKI